MIHWTTESLKTPLLQPTKHARLQKALNKYNINKKKKHLVKVQEPRKVFHPFHLYCFFRRWLYYTLVLFLSRECLAERVLPLSKVLYHFIWLLNFRTTPHNRWYASSERAGATGGESTPSTPGGGTESGRRRCPSGSASSRSDSSSPEPSDTSRASTPPTQPPSHNNHRTPTSLPHQVNATIYSFAHTFFGWKEPT